jgi:hypothetical protein
LRLGNSKFIQQLCLFAAKEKREGRQINALIWRSNQDWVKAISANRIIALRHELLGVEGSEKRPVQDENKEGSLELLDLRMLPLMSPPQRLQTERRSGTNQRSKCLDREPYQEAPLCV